MYLSDASSIAQHRKKQLCPTTEIRKILTGNKTILEEQNSKKKKRQILQALHMSYIQHKLNIINFSTSVNVPKCL